MNRESVKLLRIIGAFTDQYANEKGVPIAKFRYSFSASRDKSPHLLRMAWHSPLDAGVGVYAIATRTGLASYERVSSYYQYIGSLYWCIHVVTLAGGRIIYNTLKWHGGRRVHALQDCAGACCGEEQIGPAGGGKEEDEVVDGDGAEDEGKGSEVNGDGQG